MTNLDSIFKSRDYFANKGSSSQGYGFSCGHVWVCFPGGSDGKESACSAGDPGLISGSGRCPGEGNGNPL